MMYPHGWNLGFSGLGMALAACLTACGSPPVTGETGTDTDTGTGTGTSTTDAPMPTTTSTPGTTSIEPTTGSATGDPTTDLTTGGSTSDSTTSSSSGGTGSTGPSGSTGTSTAGMGVCGDGAVDVDEVCDDGINDGAYGGCMPDCSALGPNCGDAAVNGPEVCDDGVNDGSYGGCAADCAALGPSCGDGVVNGPETCDDGNMNNQDACINACIVPKNCLDIKMADPAAMDGVYQFTVGMTTWQAYCDMTTDGGGWTLAAKVTPTDAWQYSAARWTDASLVAPNQPNFDHVTAKLATWNEVPFTEILLGVESPVGMMNPPVPKYVQLAIAANSLFSLFSPNMYVATNATKAEWLTLAPMASLQTNCNQQGINNQPAGNNVGRVRLGILSNTQNDCMTPESAVGAGFGTFPCQNNPSIRTGNIHCEQGTEIQKAGMAFIFVR